MNKKTKSLMGIAFPCLFLGGLILGRSCSTKPETTHSAHAVGHEVAKQEVWTCSMHPQVQQAEPGLCPICGMDLIPLDDEGGDALGARELKLSEAAEALVEVETTTVERRFPEMNLELVGMLGHDETLMRSLTARFPVRIDRLFVNYTGISVEAGEHLAEVYSPELLITQKELLGAYANDPEGWGVRGAREKLLLWDLMPDQIDAIIERGYATDHFELRAPMGGVVVEKQVNEGAYLDTGDPFFTIADLSQLWLKLEAYESDLAFLRYGQTVQFTVQAYPGEVFEGPISFISPELDSATRTVSVRVNVDNAEGRLKPGMLARGQVAVQLSEAGRVYEPDLAGKWISPMHPEVIKDGPGQCDVCGMDLVPVESLGYAVGTNPEAPLLVPSSAVLRTGKRGVVYLRRPSAEGGGIFEGREVVLGPRAGGYFIVREGLEEGDRVVTRGAFKIDSALQIQAKPSMMSGDGEASDMSEHVSEAGKLQLEADQLGALLPGYFDLQAALAGDDVEAARKALKDMMSVSGHHGSLAALIHAMLDAEDLDGMRRPYFDQLSQAFINAAKAHPGQLENPVYQMHCPMVYPGRGADWLQSDDDLLNPYFGAMMLRCGEMTATLGEAHHEHEMGGEDE